MNEYIELMERTLSEWMREYPIEWIELAYKDTVGKPATQECQAESGKFDTAFQDGYDTGYAQARFDYEQEPRKGQWGWLRCDMYVCSECKNVYTDLSGIKDRMNYCPNCGSRNEVEK